MRDTASYASPLGNILLAADEEGLATLDFADAVPGKTALHHPAIASACCWLDLYFSGAVPGFVPPLHLVGTAFRMEVWRLLLEIPYGETVSYGELAKKIAARRGLSRMSAQAIGGAVGHNPIALIVPCHRVVGADGSLVGYASGLHRKSFLLEWEGQNKFEIRKSEFPNF